MSENPARVTKHGTHGGIQNHRREKTPMCQECKDFLTAYKAEYYLRNREYKIAYTAKYRKENQEKIKAGKKLWEANNRDKVQASKRKSYYKNPGQSLAKRNRRRARILGNGYIPYTLEQVLEEYGSVCYLCEVSIDLTLPRKAGTPGWEMALHIDHVRPLYKGGSDSIDNVAPTHALCNLSKGIY
jgi:5-methylcytosine-specific restriction endonuclease McrA